MLNQGGWNFSALFPMSGSGFFSHHKSLFSNFLLQINSQYTLCPTTTAYCDKPLQQNEKTTQILRTENSACQPDDFVTMERAQFLLHVQELPQKNTGNRTGILKIKHKITANIQLIVSTRVLSSSTAWDRFLPLNWSQQWSVHNHLCIYTCKVKGNIYGFDPHFRSENVLGSTLVTWPSHYQQASDK